MKQVNEPCSGCNIKENVYASGYGQDPLCLKCLDRGMDEKELDELTCAQCLANELSCLNCFLCEDCCMCTAEDY